MIHTYDTIEEFEKDKDKLKENLPVYIAETAQTLIKLDGEWLGLLEEEV